MPAALAEPLSLQPIDVSPAHRPVSAGPGWFDSSWELSTGLQVEEGLPADLPLDSWLEVWHQIVEGKATSLSLAAA